MDEFEALYEGGMYELVDKGGMELPAFVFGTRDLEATRRFLRGMYVDLDVRLDRGGNVAYHLGVPDRKTANWSIPIKEADIPRIEKAFRMLNTCVVGIKGTGGSIPLQEFATDLTLEFTGTYGKGLAAFTAGDIDTAERILKPLADGGSDAPCVHHILGRCYRARGNLEQAVAHYMNAAERAVGTLDSKMLPAAAGILSDMGVSYKKMGNQAKAAHCFVHSLHLRPNHPEALATFCTLFPEKLDVAVHGVARILAIGRNDSLAAQVGAALAGANRMSTADFMAQAKAASRAIDLEVWPLAKEELASFEKFKAGLATAGGALPGLPSIPRGKARAAAEATETEDEAPRKPWWKFW